MGDALSARDKLFGMLFDTDSDVFIDVLKKGIDGVSQGWVLFLA